MKKLNLIAFVLTLITGSAFAQKTTLTFVGTIADSVSKQPLAYCTLQIFDKNDTTKRLDATTTNIDGHFTFNRFKQKPSVAKISYIGYKTLVFEIDFTKVKNDTLNFDTVYILSEANNLGTVTVEAKARRFEMDVDKLTMNIDEGLSSVSENAFDLLKKTPGVSIDQDENLTLNGQSGAKFQFNGKDMKLAWEAIKSMLKSMTPDKIQKIEVISNPSAKYESDGTAGIINIVMDSKKNYGIHGSVGSSASYNMTWDYSGNANLSYMDDKWTFSTWGNKNWNNFKSLGSWSENKKWLDGSDTTKLYSQNPENESFGSRISVGFYGDYTIDSNNLIGFNMFYYDSYNPASGSLSNTQFSSSKDAYQTIDSSYRNETKNNYSYTIISAGLNYIHAFDTNDTKLSTDIDFSLTKSPRFYQNDFTYFLDDFAAMTRKKGQNYNQSNDNYNLSWKADFQKKIFKNGTFETGFKMWFSKQENDMNAQIDTNNGYVNDANRTNNFRYFENVYALYVSYSHKFGKKINLRGGLRGEYTYTNGIQRIGNSSHILDYPNLFPNLRFSYLMNEKNRFTLGYNYRISRPDYSYLNPFIIQSSDYSQSQGDPDLRPAFNHNLSLSHTWNYCLTTSIYYGYSTDAIVNVPSLLSGTMITLSKPQNLATAHSLGLNISFNKSIGEKFYCYFAIGGSYNQSQYTTNNRFVDFHSFGLSGWGNLSYQLPWKINISANGYVFLNEGLSIYKSSAWSNISIGLNRAFLDNSLRVSISITNILSPRQYKTEYETPNETYKSESKEAGLGVRFGVTYSFGRMYEKKKLTAIQSDDNNDRSGGGSSKSGGE
ncbi:MAG: TonB-dependent receptor [Bacteroidales bacterium]|jgi:hypothetical protein|nr:TonB-dependent receptor [Bacteroidales bacterium]